MDNFHNDNNPIIIYNPTLYYDVLQELFKRLIPHQCLGATWSRRDKSEANTVLATVTQFNAVSFRVISSILIEPKLRPQVRFHD